MLAGMGHRAAWRVLEEFGVGWPGTQQFPRGVRPEEPKTGVRAKCCAGLFIDARLATATRWEPRRHLSMNEWPGGRVSPHPDETLARYVMDAPGKHCVK